MFLAGISIHEEEDLKIALDTAKRFQELGADVVFVVDKPVQKLWPVLSEYEWIATGTYGIGNARDAVLRYGVEHGYDCIMIPDCHVYPESITGICSVAMSYGMAEGGRVDVDKARWPSYTHTRPWHGRVYSPSLEQFVEVYDCIYKPWSYEPLLAFSSKAIQHLMEVQNGRVIVGFGFGGELAELVLSLWRLGYKLHCTNIRYAHVYKTDKSPEWVKRWNPTQLLYSRNSYGAYALKHLTGKCLKKYENDISLLTPWQVKIIERFKEHAIYSTEEIYKKTGFSFLYDC